MTRAGKPGSAVDKLPSGRYRARYRDAEGKQHSATFDLEPEARRWLRAQRADVDRGAHVAPRAGQVTFRDYAEQWRAAQVHRLSTASHVEGQLRRHAYPVLGDKPMSVITQTTIQGWVKRLESDLAPRTVAVIYSIVGGVFNSAVIDKVIPATPCVKIKRTQPQPAEVTPLPTATVHALAASMPPCLSAMVTVAAGTGLRFGEVAGLTVDQVDFLRRELTVKRQLSTVDGRTPFLSDPKTSASCRKIPLAATVVDALAAHLAAFPARTHDVPTDSPDGDRVPVELIFTTPRGYPIRRTSFGDIWRKAAADAGAPAGTGFHALRHFFASLLIRHGESVTVVQKRLGHSTAAETLDCYSHLWPDSDDTTRAAIDSVLGSHGVSRPVSRRLTST